jgi:S1-C subfamily serine protease
MQVLCYSESSLGTIPEQNVLIIVSMFLKPEVSMGSRILGVVLSVSIPFVVAVRSSYASDPAPRVPHDIRPAQTDIESARRTATTLQKLGRNLILDRTRGERDIAVFQKAAPAVVLVLGGKDSIGSGALISSDGRVITNWHVVRGNQQVVVVLKPKDSSELKKELAFAAVVEKFDQVADLALLKIVTPPNSMSFLSLGGASSLSVGQDVHAIGHPQGEVWTYTRGIISQIRSNYEWKTQEGIHHRANVIQTQTPINPGNSGGPLLDDGARLIGINSFKAGGEGLNYAVSVDAIAEFLARASSRETVQTPPVSKAELRCVEGYDALRRGWNDIIGCYQDSVSPPPDVWVVFRVRDKNPIYVGMDTDTSGKAAKIDLIKKNLDPDWKITELYLDADCDGTIDVIEKQVSGRSVSSRIAPPNLRVTSLANELNTALKNGRVPYRNLRVCQ